MNLTLMFRVVCYVSLVVVLAVWETSAPAAVITTGDVDPGGSPSSATAPVAQVLPLINKPREIRGLFVFALFIVNARSC